TSSARTGHPQVDRHRCVRLQSQSFRLSVLGAALMSRNLWRMMLAVLVGFSLALTTPAQELPQAPAPPLPIAPRVAEVTKDLRDKLNLDPFYQTHLDLDGLPILTSAKVSDEALVEAAYLIRQMLAKRPDVFKEMVKNRVRFVIMAPTEMTTDVPEQRHL